MIDLQNLDRLADEVAIILAAKYGIRIRQGSLLERTWLSVREQLDRREFTLAHPELADFGFEFSKSNREIGGLALFL